MFGVIMSGNFDDERVVEFLRTTFETIDQAITIYDADMRLVAWNDQYRSLGMMPEKHIRYGASLYEAYKDIAKLGVFGPGDPTELSKLHVNALRDGPLIEEEFLKSVDGKKTHRIKRFRLPDGGVCATFTDVTEELELQEHLRQSTKMDAIGRLTGGVAHDFNNVLAVIIGNLELFQEIHGETKNDDLLDGAISAANRGAKLTHRLLAFARKQPLSPLVTKPNLVLSELIPMLRTLLGEHIEVELVCDAGIWSIEIDRNELENVVVNIAANARDAMRTGGKLTIEASNTRVDEGYAKIAEIARGQYVCISCTDTGTGMKEEVLRKAFDPFFSTKEVGSGTGLGLSMAHGFVRQSNGHIKLYSELGEGTVVKMYLPRIHGKDIESPNDQILPVDPLASETSILVVEDDPQFRVTVRTQLLSANYRVLTAENGRAALKILESDATIDLLLTDVVLPGGLNGRDISEQAKVLRPNIRVLYMSGYSENSIIHHGRLDKGVTLIQKPFQKLDLIREIIEAMKKP
jgi:signal transduction histidine kinase/CheY-like chemotaxis protein